MYQNKTFQIRKALAIANHIINVHYRAYKLLLDCPVDNDNLMSIWEIKRDVFCAGALTRLNELKTATLPIEGDER